MHIPFAEAVRLFPEAAFRQRFAKIATVQPHKISCSYVYFEPHTHPHRFHSGTENIIHDTKSSATGSQQHTHTDNQQTLKQTSSRETTGRAETRLEGMEQRKKKDIKSVQDLVRGFGMIKEVWEKKKRWGSATVINSEGPQKLVIMCSCGHSGDDSKPEIGWIMLVIETTGNTVWSLTSYQLHEILFFVS